ncbi:UBX domain-containing protein 4 [Fopius arisanus]|uniref:UBX domain-containing protein 4 n=2 Tax=Fopius arisanus TaxID=64838 RepID=A0A0C9Q2N1_9HYME|nr:PREDICTED: UBX domain-containing protein 4 [Fopius arisanus]
MKWFPGSINEAVAASKSRKAVFVVFVAGKDDASTETAGIIDSPEISSRLEHENFVAIRLESDTDSYRFFAQIYQLVPIPSLFFIGDNGSPLEIVAGTVNAQTLHEKIDAVLQKASKGKNEISGDFIRGEQSASAAGQSVPASSSAGVVSPQVQRNEGASGSSGETPGLTPLEKKPAELTPEEKVERARQLIELQKQQRIEKEREEERQREIERRRVGKDAQTARQRHQELEIKMAQEERAKEKAAESEARERVRQQIAQDKVERKQREQTLLQQNSQQSQDRPQQPAAPPADGVVRIQFRLPSGNPHMGKFELTSTLRDLRAYVTSNIDLPFRNFTMSTSFPRRDLSAEDDGRTLVDLQLVPTAVILILPLKNSTTTSAVASREEGSFLSRFMWTVFSPIISVFNYVVSYFTGPSTSGSSREGNDEASPAGVAPRATPTRQIGQPSGLFGRNLGGPSTTIRARGNIHRLYTGGDDNDENNTWNGNSTQQM